MLLSIDLGSVPDWISAGLSALAIYFVYWQVNRQIKNEKILKTEFSRPIFFYSKSSVINDFKQFYFEIQA